MTLNERQVQYYPEGGHDHDGHNSSPVKIQPKAITLEMLSQGVIDFILAQTGGPGSGGTGLSGVPDLTFTATVAAGSSVWGELPWIQQCLVRYVSISMSADTECTLMFFHNVSYFDAANREFKSQNCVNGFLWEGPWVHYNDTILPTITYTLENTGATNADFTVTLKANGIG